MQGITQLALQILYIDGRILVVCIGPSGESYAFIDDSDSEILLGKSLQLHHRIERLIKDEGKGTSITKRRRGGLADSIKDLGELLFQKIFKDQILDLFNIAVGQSIRLDNTVVIRLMIASDFLNIVPWELLCDNGMYLCHSYDIFRHPCVRVPVRRPFLHDGRVSLLFIGANPANDILVSNQIKAVTDSIETNKVDFYCLQSPEATYTNIASQIYDGVDILHIVAHGKYKNDGNQSKYYFIVDSEDARNKAPFRRDTE